MPTIDEFKARLKFLGDQLQNKLPDIAMGLTIAAKSLAERRIKDKGFGAVYSQNKIPAWFLHGKELNAAGSTFLENHGVTSAGKQGTAKKKRRKKKDDPDPGSYDTMTNWGEFRAAQGLQVDHVDLGYTNKMWANMGPGEVERTGPVVLVPLVATNREAQDKMNWNRDRYGDFIGKALTEDDRGVLTEYVTGEVINFLDQHKI